jgi:hypothetical protein
MLPAHVMSVLLARILNSVSSPANALEALYQLPQVSPPQLDSIYDRVFRKSWWKLESLSTEITEAISTAYKLITAFPARFFSSRDLASCAIVASGIEKLTLQSIRASKGKKVDESILHLLLVSRILLRHLYQRDFEAVSKALPSEALCTLITSTTDLLRYSLPSTVLLDFEGETVRLLYSLCS